MSLPLRGKLGKVTTFGTLLSLTPYRTYLSLI
jgi:hypothetical protein